MGKYISWLTEGAHKILLVNCAGLPEADILQGMEEYRQEILNLPRDSKLLVLMDMSKTNPSALVNAKGRELVETAKTHGLPTYPTAIVGFSSIQKAIAQMFLSLQKDDSVHLVDTLEQGKSWLIQRAK